MRVINVRPFRDYLHFYRDLYCSVPVKDVSNFFEEVWLVAIKPNNIRNEGERMRGCSSVIIKKAEADRVFRKVVQVTSLDIIAVTRELGWKVDLGYSLGNHKIFSNNGVR